MSTPGPHPAPPRGLPTPHKQAHRGAVPGTARQSDARAIDVDHGPRYKPGVAGCARSERAESITFEPDQGDAGSGDRNPPGGNLRREATVVAGIGRSPDRAT